MVEHPHVDQRQRIAELAGQLPIGLTRLGDAGGVVVSLIVYAL